MLKKCKDYLLYSQERLLTLFPERAERRKRNEKPEEEQEDHSGPVSLPWDTIANYMGIAAILTFKS